MDINLSVYDFIESEAIREYLIGLHYSFTTPEAAFLVWHCKSATLKEKFAAWENIIRTMPNCGMLKRSYMKAIPDFHVFLQKYIDLQKRYIRRFKTAGTGLYFFSFDDDYEYGPFDNFQTCIETAFINAEEYHAKEIRMDLKAINPKDYFNKIASCCLNPEGEFLQIDWQINGETEDDIETSLAFEGMWFGFPTPFRSGDILCEMTDTEEKHPFVLAYLSQWEIKKMAQLPGAVVPAESSLRGDGHVHAFCMKADNSDMRAYGYQVKFDGVDSWDGLYLDFDFSGCADYLDLAYCKKPLHGCNRLLNALSDFLKKEIDLDVLLNTYLMYGF